MPSAPLPPISPRLLRGFIWYAQRYVRKHFHAVRVLRGHEPELPEEAAPLIVLNHPSWWDPLACWYLHGRYPGFTRRAHYSPMDAAMLEQYGVFKRLGFFGIDPDRARGAATFLRTGEAVLASPLRALWVTAQGGFRDVRERPVSLRPGVAHLAARLRKPSAPTPCVVLPLALEYTFWDQRTPELLMAFGRPMPLVEGPDDAAAWQGRLEAALQSTMQALAEAAIRRDPERFVTLSTGRRGVGGLYDGARRLKAMLRGRAFDPTHGSGRDRGPADESGVD